MINSTPSRLPFSKREIFLPFSKPDIGEEELQQVAEVLKSGWLTTGPKTKLFEQLMAEYLGVDHAIAVNSCTSAMHLALEAIGVSQGDEVITSTYTFAASAEVIRYLNAHPILVDIEPETLNLDPSQIEKAITDKTKAIIPVDIAGQAADLDAIKTIADRHNVVILEDAAHALPTRYKDRLVGSISDFTAFSFYATKTLATGEGGMLTTNNPEWAERCRIMSLHGISKDAWKRYTNNGNWYYEIMAPGFKYNMPDLVSAIGIAQLQKLEPMTYRRVEIAKHYSDAFKGHPALQIPIEAAYSTHCYHLYILRLNLEQLRADRSQFIDSLREMNIGSSVHFIPLHLHPYYRETYHYNPDDFPVAYQEYQRAISLPIYSAMTDSDVNYVIETILNLANFWGQ